MLTGEHFSIAGDFVDTSYLSVSKPGILLKTCRHSPDLTNHVAPAASWISSFTQRRLSFPDGDLD